MCGTRVFLVTLLCAIMMLFLLSCLRTACLLQKKPVEGYTMSGLTSSSGQLDLFFFSKIMCLIAICTYRLVMMSSDLSKKFTPARANGHCLRGRNCYPLLLFDHISQLYFVCNHLIIFIINLYFRGKHYLV